MELEEALALIEAQKSDIEKRDTEVSSMQAKLDELLGETKKAKAKAKEEADLAAKALADKALKDGDFEQLLKSSETEREKAASELLALRANIQSEKVNSEAMRLASELADGHNAALLSEFISRRLKYTDDGYRVLDAKGELTISTIDDLKTEFEKGERYQSLIRGNQASGGGALGGKGSAVNKKFTEMNGGELKALRASNPAEYDRLKSESKT